MLFIQHPVGLSDSSGRNKVPTSPARPHQHVHDDWRCRHTLSSTALQARHFRVCVCPFTRLHPTPVRLLTALEEVKCGTSLLTHFVALPSHRRGRDYASRNSWKSSSLSFGRETHVPCVGPASPPESEHSGPSWASQGSDWPPLRGHIFHLVLRRKSPCEVAESVIRNTISWTGSEPEYRDAVCVGFLRNSTVIMWTFTSERSTERGSLFPFFVLAMEARKVRTLQDKAESLMARRDRLCCLRRFGRRESHPTTLWGKSPFEVVESVIGRPQNNSS